MRKLYIPVVDLVRPALGALIGLTLVASLLTFRLGTIHEGVGQSEVASVQAVQQKAISGNNILRENSLYLPHKVGLYVLQKADAASVKSVRTVGVIFGLIGITAFYVVIRKWHTRRIALITAGLLATSSWFLYTARLAAPESSYLLLPLLIYFGIRLQENNLRFLGLGAITFLVAVMLYIPGLCWFIIPAAVWQRQRVRRELRHAGKTRSTVLGLGVAITLVPLALSFMNNPGLVADWLGLTGPQLSIVEYAKNLVGVPVQIFLHSNYDPATHLGRLPYLDVATTVFMALGAYRYIHNRKLDRSKLLVGGLIIGSALAALNFAAAPVLLPFLYIGAASGVALLLQQWFTVFPRNPLARNIGVAIIIGILSLTGLFHLRRYFVAWPNAPETRQAYSITSFPE